MYVYTRVLGGVQYHFDNRSHTPWDLGKFSFDCHAMCAFATISQSIY